MLTALFLATVYWIGRFVFLLGYNLEIKEDHILQTKFFKLQHKKLFYKDIDSFTIRDISGDKTKPDLILKGGGVEIKLRKYITKNHFARWSEIKYKIIALNDDREEIKKIFNCFDDPISTLNLIAEEVASEFGIDYSPCKWQANMFSQRIYSPPSWSGSINGLVINARIKENIKVDPVEAPEGFVGDIQHKNNALEIEIDLGEMKTPFYLDIRSDDWLTTTLNLLDNDKILVNNQLLDENLTFCTNDFQLFNKCVDPEIKKLLAGLKPEFKGIIIYGDKNEIPVTEDVEGTLDGHLMQENKELKFINTKLKFSYTDLLPVNGGDINKNNIMNAFRLAFSLAKNIHRL